MQACMIACCCGPAGRQRAPEEAASAQPEASAEAGASLLGPGAAGCFEVMTHCLVQLDMSNLSHGIQPCHTGCKHHTNVGCTRQA